MTNSKKIFLLILIYIIYFIKIGNTTLSQTITLPCREMDLENFTCVSQVVTIYAGTQGQLDEWVKNTINFGNFNDTAAGIIWGANNDGAGLTINTSTEVACANGAGIVLGVIDNCPNGDFTGNNRDGACGKVPVDGACTWTPGVCSAGNPINLNISTKCGETSNWSCAGLNGGANQPCSSVGNSACPTIETPKICPTGTTGIYPNCIIKTTTITPPSAPIITTSNSSESCSYISSWSPNWTNCNINSNWTSDGKISCSQTNNWSTNISTASWSCATTYVNGISNGTSCNGFCPGNAPQTAQQKEIKTLSMLLSNPTTITNNAYANNIDRNNIKVNIYGSTNQNKPITGLVGSAYASIGNIQDKSGFKANRIDNSGANALNFDYILDSDIKGSGNNFYFDITGIRSYAPISTDVGKISFEANGVIMNLSNVDYKFDKIFTSSFNTTNLKIGTTQKIELGVTKVNSSNSSISGYNFSNINYSIGVNPNDRFVIQNKGSEYKTNSNPVIDLRINYKGGTNISSDKPPYLSVKPIISYRIDGVSTKYYVSPEKDSSKDNYTNSSNAKFDSIKVSGNIQSQGKAELTGQTKNFSDLSKTTQRAEIRKNATLLTKSMTSGSKVNGVKYFDGDTTISGNNLGYETIVVKDGNLTISGDLNTDGKKLGIIVLKDGYNIDNGYEGNGNIYINKGVKYINATIYADGGIISSNNGTPYILDSDSRTSALQTQLVIKGSIFSRNTIGGAILGTFGKYKLPGGQETNDFDKAMIYDMNYLRRGNENQDFTKNLGNSNNVVIIYNSSIQTNPPKGFNFN